jgi:hypothetical protein
MARRTKSTEFARGATTPIDNSYNDQAGALKVISGVVGVLEPMGDLATAKPVTKSGDLVAVFNPLTTILFAKTGTDTVVAPTDGTNGICLRPMDYTIIAMPFGHTHIITNASAWGYILIDDSEIR